MSTATSAPTLTMDATEPSSDPFAPGRNGMIGIYALRIIDRGADPRRVVAAHRATRYGLGPSPGWQYAAATTPEPIPVGRDTPGANPAAGAAPLPATVSTVAAAPVRARRLSLPTLAGISRFVFGPATPTPARQRRMVIAGVALALALGSLGVRAQEYPAAQRYVVQPGDTLGTVAAGFGVDPLAVAIASGIEQIDTLAPEQVLIIPAPEQDVTTLTGSELETALNVTGAYVVAEGDTLNDIGAWFGVPVVMLQEVNGIANPEHLAPGQRLVIPANAPVAADTAPAPELAAFEAQPAAVDDAGAVAVASAVEIPSVPAYQQAYPLSSEYAAAFIATSALGTGVPEAAFIAAVPRSENPHRGYRGNLAGPWGSTTDYGVYAEPLAPVLNAYGFAADMFYANGDAAALTSRLDAGLPVITWLGFYGDTAYTVPDEGHGTYELAAGMRAVVVYGYDDTGVLVSDPLSGSYQHYGWDEFLAAWNVLDGMGLAVAPS